MAAGAPDGRARGLPRFAAELPAVQEFVSLGEGDTPLLRLPNLARHLGLGRVSGKMELHNPTGSYKDRVAAMSLSLARERGNRGWITSSSGNTGLAMAAYGARAGLPGFLCVSASAPMEKRAPLKMYPIGVVGLAGTGAGATIGPLETLEEELRSAAERHNLYLGMAAHSVNHNGMRGVDTIGYELAEQAESATHVYVPTGAGGLLTSIARGMERRAMKTRIIACQPAGCAPIVHYVTGASTTPKVYKVESGISGLQVPNPADGHLAAQAVTRSHGWGTVANDDEIVNAQRLLAALEGVFVEPAAAIAVAALIKDVEYGQIDAFEHPVLILTGAGWKDLARLTDDAQAVPVVKPSEIATHVDKWADGMGGTGRD